MQLRRNEIMTGLLVLSTVAQQAIQFLGYRQLEFVDLGPVVAAKHTSKFLGTDIQRRQMEGMIVGHVDRSPKRTVPSRIIVAPSSTAIG